MELILAIWLTFVLTFVLIFGLTFDLILDPKWRLDVYTSGIGRCLDYENYDFVKHKAKYPEVMQALYK